MQVLLASTVTITSQATVFSYKPNEKWVTNNPYIYFDCTNLTTSIIDNYWERARRCSAVIYVVWPVNDNTRLDEYVVDLIIESINNFLISERCFGIDKVDGIPILSITSRQTSPMGYTEKNRPIRSATYDIIYSVR